MIRRILIAIALLAMPSIASAREAFHGWCELGNQSVVTQGLSSTTKAQQSNPSCVVTVFVHGGGLATIYSDNNNTPLANPFQAQFNGLVIFYANDGRYDIQFSPGTTYLDWLLCDPFTPGSVCSGASSGAHNLLSTMHLDTIPFSPPVRGDLITAQNLTSPTSINPSWARLPLGSNNFVLTSNGVDAIWAPVPAASGCSVGSLLDTWIVFIHPNATCFGSTKLTWDNANQLLSGGDGTTTFANSKTVFNFGVSNVIKDMVDPGFGTTGLVIGDANNLWGIPVTGSQELYIIGDLNNNQRNSDDNYIMGQSNSIVDVQSNHFILGNSNHFKSGTVSTQANMNHGFAMGSSNNATVTPTGSLNNYGFTGTTNTITVSTGRTITNVFLHGSQNTATLTTNNDHDIYAFGTGNTFEDDLNLTEQAMALGFLNDIDGANSTAQTLGIANILHNVSINGGNTVVVGGVNAATTLGTIGTQYQEIFGHSNNLNNCSDCIIIGANVVETTNHEMGIGMAATPALKIDVNGSGDNILRTPHAFSYYPACAGGTEGSWASVTDSTTATAGATITGGGSNHVLGYCNATSWIVVSGNATSGAHHGLSFTIGAPGGTALAAASTTTDYITVPFACTINAYNLAIDAGTITVKFWKIATGTAIPTSGNSINTSGVGISSGTAIHSTTLSDFTTTAVAANDIMAMNVTVVATAAFVNGVLSCQE